MAFWVYVEQLHQFLIVRVSRVDKRLVISETDRAQE